MSKKESILQKQAIEHLEKNGWKYIKLNNLDNVKSNFKKMLEHNPKNIERFKKLNKTTLSDLEFNRLMVRIEQNINFSDYAEFLLDEDHSIQTDDNQTLYLNLFDKKAWCKNVFQITDELQENNIRHDLVFLINGIPIANLELKAPHINLKNAINQTEVYSKKLSSIMKFIEIFMVSNENDTLYYANNEKINTNYTFHYTDSENRPIKNLFKFIDSFLEVCTFSKYIARYVINKRAEKTLIALRGYQVHAAEAVVNHIETSHETAYVWHATGSGKTITSFKVAKIISEEFSARFAKVLFIVDRRDLDAQTLKEYNSFLGGHEQIQETNNTKILRKQLLDPKQKLIISTMQKLYRVLTKYPEHDFAKQKFVFIFDECHRSQFGDMQNLITQSFKNSTFIGFTGTPIFIDDDGKFKQITTDIFKKNLHKYLIQNAIEDKNVLPLQLTCIAPNLIEDKNVSKFLGSINLLKAVAKDIIEHFQNRSCNYQYTSFVVLKDVKTLMKFYDMFEDLQTQEQQLKPDYRKLVIAATFSAKKENDYSDEFMDRKSFMQKMITNFNKATDSNETVEDINQYQNRLQAVIKDNKGIPKVNITLVVDQLLTGFDAKKINTIYIVKDLRNHSLIQAVSRTNRVFDGEKRAGIIISYVPNFKEHFDDAVKMYSNSNNADAFSVRDYNQILQETKYYYQTLKNIDVQEKMKDVFGNKKELSNFLSTLNKFIDNYKLLRTMDNYDDSSIDENFNVDVANNLISTGKEIRKLGKEAFDKQTKNNNEKINEFDNIEIQMEISSKTLVDEQYIRRLCGNIDENSRQGNYPAALLNINELKSKLSSVENANFLIEWCNKMENQLKAGDHIDATQMLVDVLNQKINDFENKYKINESDLESIIHLYKLKEHSNSTDYKKITEKWINNIIRLDSLKYLERRKTMKHNETIILETIKMIIKTREILGA